VCAGTGARSSWACRMRTRGGRVSLLQASCRFAGCCNRKGTLCHASGHEGPDTHTTLEIRHTSRGHGAPVTAVGVTTQGRGRRVTGPASHARLSPRQVMLCAHARLCAHTSWPLIDRNAAAARSCALWGGWVRTRAHPNAPRSTAAPSASQLAASSHRG
jgi:hypothetical protein